MKQGQNVAAIDYLGLEADLREMVQCAADRRESYIRLNRGMVIGDSVDWGLSIFVGRCAAFADEIASRRDQG